MTRTRTTTTTTRLAAVAAVVTLGLAACGEDGNDTDSAPVASPAETTADMTEEMTDEMTEASMGSIVDVAVGAGSFTTLVAAVQAAGLEDTLATGGPFTVFAPTDEAFAAALEELGITADDLLADTETLTSILTYHVVDGAVPAETVVTLDGQSVETLNGAEVEVTVDGDTVMVNDATVTAVDVEADNGIIHVLDTVLLPPSS